MQHFGDFSNTEAICIALISKEQYDKLSYCKRLVWLKVVLGIAANSVLFGHKNAYLSAGDATGGEGDTSFNYAHQPIQVNMC